jgi:hypothetical protein
MGYYIEVESNKNKAEIIAANYDGMVIPKVTSYEKIPKDKGLIIVVDNGMFEAAAFIYNEYEFAAFTHPSDERPRKFVLLDRERAETLSRYRK